MDKKEILKQFQEAEIIFYNGPFCCKTLKVNSLDEFIEFVSKVYQQFHEFDPDHAIKVKNKILEEDVIYYDHMILVTCFWGNRIIGCIRLLILNTYLKLPTFINYNSKEYLEKDILKGNDYFIHFGRFATDNSFLHEIGITKEDVIKKMFAAVREIVINFSKKSIVFSEMNENALIALRDIMGIYPVVFAKFDSLIFKNQITNLTYFNIDQLEIID